MKKRDLLSLAMLGVGAGLLLGACQGGNQKPTTSAAEQMSPDMQSFYNSLSTDAQKKFDQLDAKHKNMVMEMMKQDCKGKNDCKGMGGCKTADHECAGKNECKGKGGPAEKNSNKAVEAQYLNQTKERSSMGAKVSATTTTTTAVQ